MAIPQQFQDLSPCRPYRQFQRPQPKVPGPYLKPLPPRAPQFEVLGYTSKGGAQERDDSVPSPVFTPLSRSRWSNPFLDQEEDDSQQKVDSNQKQGLLTYEAIPITKFMRAPVYSLSSGVGKILSHLDIDPQFKAVIFKLSARFGRYRSSGRDTSRDFLQSHPVGCWRSANFALNQFATNDHWSLPASHFLETCLRYSPLDYKLYLFNHFRGSVIKETTTIYNGFLDEMNTCEKYKHTRQFFYQMRAVGPNPNRTTYKNVIHAMAKRRRYDEIITLSEEMKGLGFYEVSKNLMWAQYKKGRYGDAVETYKKLQKDAVRLNISSYNIILQSYEKLGDYTACIEVYKELEKHCPKNAYTFSLMFIVLDATEKYEWLCSLFEEMKQTYKGVLNIIAYNIVFKAMDHQGQYEQLYEAFDQVRAHQTPGAELYGTIIRACINAKNPEKAKAYFLDGREIDSLGLRPLKEKNGLTVIDLHESDDVVERGGRPKGVSLEIAQLNCEWLLEGLLRDVSNFEVVTGQGTILRNELPVFFEEQGFHVQWDAQHGGSFMCKKRVNEETPSSSSQQEAFLAQVDVE